MTAGVLSGMADDDRIGLVDMDGTLADFDSAMSEGLAALRHPGEPDPVPPHGPGAPPWIKARRALVKAQPGFWRGLRPLPGGFRVLRLMQEVGLAVHVLTKGPAGNPRAWMEKVEWCLEHCPDLPVSAVSDKGMTYGRLLFDDWVPYAEAWLKWRPRGRVVMPAWPHNEGFRHPQVLRVGLEVDSSGRLARGEEELIAWIREAWSREGGAR